MEWLTKKVSGLNQIGGFPQRNLLPLRERKDICTWIDVCPEIIVYRMGINCIAEHFMNCERYKSVTDEQLEKFSTELKHMNPKEALAFVNGLPNEIYKPFLNRIIEKTAKAFGEQNKKCLARNGCSLDTYYDTEHP